MRTLRALAAVTAALIIVGLTPVAAGAAEADPDGFVRYSVPTHADAHELWIDIEDPGLTAADVVIEVDGTARPAVDTALGSAVIVAATGTARQIAIAVTRSAEPDIALTVIDESGAILFSQHERVILTDYRAIGSPTPTPTPTLTPTGSPTPTVSPSSSAAPVSTGSTGDGTAREDTARGDTGAAGTLPRTGGDTPVALWVVIGLLTIGTGVALVVRHLRRRADAGTEGAVR